MDSELEANHNALFHSLGRSLVRVQSIELFLKRLLAARAFGGTVQELEVWLTARHADYATNTLGTLVNELLERHLVSESYQAQEAPDPPEGTHIYLRFENVVTMEDARLLEMRALFKGLVAARNDIVHHLVERFPLNTPEGCAEAHSVLAAFESMLKKVRDELDGWAKARDKAALVHAEFMKSPEFQNYLLDGILPDGAVHWELSGIVRALRDAAKTRPEGEWMPLDDAVAWIRREAPLQIPSRYYCKTYRQAIRRSQAFETRLEPQADGSALYLYRSK